MFDSLMVEEKDGVKNLISFYDILDYRLDKNGKRYGEQYKLYDTLIVLDYINRLEDPYIFKKVK
jgi:hypothetical protein